MKLIYIPQYALLVRRFEKRLHRHMMHSPNKERIMCNRYNTVIKCNGF